jgi:hypothetical protein
VIKLATERSQARLDIAKAVPVSQLGKAHRQKLIPAREAPRAAISAVPGHACPFRNRFIPGCQVGQIRRSKWANLDDRTHFSNDGRTVFSQLLVFYRIASFAVAWLDTAEMRGPGGSLVGTSICRWPLRS